jgi:pyridoxamine 5'-phosphate oxidase
MTGRLLESEADPDPIRQFAAWWAEVLASDQPQPEAMALATADAHGRPSVRMVLLKGADEQGFVFYTNQRSRKGRELEANPSAAVVLYWVALHRQVRARGLVTRLSTAESEAYFRSRPRGAQLSAAASHQSEVVPDREWLERRVSELETRFDGREVPLPEDWGGYRLAPDEVEFWQGDPNRLHDRLRYRRREDGWVIERLAP